MDSNARSPRRSSAGGRALLAFAAALAAAGVALTVMAFAGDDGSAAVLEVDDAVAVTLPSTVPPVATTPEAAASATPPDANGDRASAATTTTTTTTNSTAATGNAAGSPLAELLGERGSAIPPALERRIRPVGLRIDDIFVDDPVRPVGLLDDGSLEVPGAEEIGWYRYGAAPGHVGATVLAAHVTWNGDDGPFLNLGDLDPGDRVEVTLEDGSVRTYEVIERTMYDKDELPRNRIWRNTGPETLVLITCGGDFNPEINRYRQNIVVYAVPVA